MMEEGMYFFAILGAIYLGWRFLMMLVSSMGRAWRGED